MSIELTGCSSPFWYAAQTRSRREFTVSSLLLSKNIETYLPTYREPTEWKDRRAYIRHPLFPGYVFVFAGPRDRHAVITTAGVIRITGAGTRPSPIEESEMLAIRKLAASGLPLRPVPYFKAGELVEVRGGPMHGFSGIVKFQKNARTLVISFGQLERSVAVELTEDCVTVARSKLLASIPKKRTA